MTVSIKIEGIRKVQNFLNGKNKEAIEAANKAIVKSGFYVQEKVQDSLAHGTNAQKAFDTGRLTQSVKAESKQKLVSTISSNVDYAKFIEYGTSKMSARPHFRNTAKKEEVKVQDFVNAEIKKVSN